MRYIVNANNYITAVSFGCYVECQDDGCTEYTGGVPAGYASLDEWYADEAEKLYRWKVVNGQLTKDSGATPPKDKTIFDLIYPVGSIYLSTVDVSPETIFGGRWQRIQDRFLLAAGETYPAGTTGGEAEHTLTIKEMPSHTHSVTPYASGGSGSSEGVQYVTGVENWVTGKAEATGGGGAHNNMPPYLAVYVWTRLSDVV